MPKKIGDLTLYSVDDLHEALGISKMTLRAYLREGRLKGRKLGVSWYVTEQALHEYFKTEEKQQSKQPETKPTFRYLVQGVNDLVSEQEECDTVEDALEVLEGQAILSLFQVEVINAETGKVVEIVKAKDFIERHA